MMFCVSWLIIGCEKEEDNIIYESNDFLIQNNITDVVKLFQQELVENNTMYIYYGYRKGKDWFALFDATSDMLIDEWYGQNRNYKSNRISITTAHTYFEKLKDGTGYFFQYHFYFPDIDYQESKIVHLQNNKNVKYGFSADNKIVMNCLNENLFYTQNLDGNEDSKYNLLDFEGNVIIQDVNQWNNEKNGIIGFKNEKLWIGYIDENGNLHEYTSKDTFERDMKIHLGYGNYQTIHVNYIDYVDLKKTEWGYVFLPVYYTTSGSSIESYYANVFIINGLELITVPLDRDNNHHNSTIQCWYDESILINSKYVLSPKGEILYEGVFPNKEDTNISVISYTDWIGINSSNWIYKSNYKKNIWSSHIASLSKYFNGTNEPKLTFTITNKSNNLWTYCCDILNYNGSNAQEIFKINIETGEITYF